MGESLIQWLGVEGYRAEWCRTGSEAVQGLARAKPDIVICDIRLPDMSGEEVFRAAARTLGQTPVLFITAFGDIDQAVRLMRAGADDYVTKPFDIRELMRRVRDLVGRRAGAGETTLGVSDSMRRIEASLRRIADVPSSVLLTGESGVGKEIAARFLHAMSAQRKAPFVAVNCAAIPDNLLESEIFGHEKGAFTGAHARHEGFAERAGDGILFLDEVFDLPLGLQAKLLRLLQDRRFLRVGGERMLDFRARVITATNADPETRVREGRFREDLFYRVNVIPIAIPALRERPDDILPLARKFLEECAGALDRPARRFSPGAEEEALAYAWPGNVRELHNRIERAVALADGPTICTGDLFPERGLRNEIEGGSLAQAREGAERRRIATALEEANGDVTAAAERLGVSRSTLFEKIRKLGVQRAG
jgi:DNA-binding NtrC family response regulator